jgi:hypothetical protein
MNKYSVLVATGYGEWVTIKAKNEAEAIQKANDGEYYDNDITSKECNHREATGDIEIQESDNETN